jgi:hypothetical protein
MASDPAAEVDAYVRQKQIALGGALALRTKVYLDLNFWIAARDAALGLRADAAALKLLHLLRRGVGHGELVCPVGDTVFAELLKQPLSDDRRIGTARIVDELSLGVALIPERRRISTEFYCLLHWLLGRPEALLDMKELVWTKVCHILGPSYPYSDDIDPGVMVSLQKKTIDTLWAASLVDMIVAAGDHGGEPEDYRPLTEDTNRQRDLWTHEITSYKAAYDIELRGAIEAFDELTADILVDLGQAAGLGAPTPGGGDRKLLLNVDRNVLLHALRGPGAVKTVRTLHVQVALHAVLRMEKARRFKPNDWLDFHHAAAALSYCDVFLTEKPLHELVRRPQLGLMALNRCQVASTLDDGVALLRGLA